MATRRRKYTLLTKRWSKVMPISGCALLIFFLASFCRESYHFAFSFSKIKNDGTEKLNSEIFVGVDDLVHRNRIADLDYLATCLANIGASLVRPHDRDFSFLVNQSFRTDGGVPYAFAQPLNEADVQATVRCARDAGVHVCARSGGHSFSGSSLCNGVVLDLSRLSTMRFEVEQSGGLGDSGENVIVGAAVTLGDLLTYVHSSRGRWLALGVCPEVGVAGFILGGGHGPYDTVLGLGCDALISYRMVARDGRVVVASREENAELFWAGCGAGAGHFGIVTELKLRTSTSTPFDRSTAFHFKWPIARAAELFTSLSRASLVDAKMWLRAVIMANAPERSHVVLFGVCFDVSGEGDDTTDCARRISKMPFYIVADMQFERIVRPTDARALHVLLLHRVIRDGDISVAEVSAALQGKHYTQGGKGDQMKIHSVFLDTRQASNAQLLQLWQEYTDACLMTNMTKAAGVRSQVCHVNPFHIPVLRGEDAHLSSFPYRKENFLTFSYIIGGEAETTERFYDRLSTILRPFTSGVYFNYPQRQLRISEYPSLYWGKFLSRFQKLKLDWDPDYFFMQQQPIPLPQHL